MSCKVVGIDEVSEVLTELVVSVINLELFLRRLVFDIQPNTKRII